MYEGQLEPRSWGGKGSGGEGGLEMKGKGQYPVKVKAIPCAIT